MNFIKKKISFIHKEGWKFSFISFVVSVSLSFIYIPLSLIGFCITFFIIWFFRDPERVSPNIPNTLVSSADGEICLIDEATPPKELGLSEVKMQRICIFMNVFNVHVNRSPINGTVKKIAYKEGSFFNASFDKASEKNERNSLIIETKDKVQIVVVQIAGLIARRILSFIDTGEHLSEGERFGLIRFGSRVDIYMPQNAKIESKLGDKVIAGETIIAYLK
ncbi:phosphatidylserine decarboxylase [SAR86 cluster bacterium]|nr:phosphatidylserine decarboxylase [SAR86 cluster bacterium]